MKALLPHWNNGSQFWAASTMSRSQDGGNVMRMYLSETVSEAFSCGGKHDTKMSPRLAIIVLKMRKKMPQLV